MPKLYAPTVVATAAPAVTDDINDGYVVGQLWLDTTADALYVCTGNAVGAADWDAIGSGGGGGAPAAHAASHASGASDPIKLDDLGTPDDNTDLNASTTRHGLLKKLSNVATEFMSGTGNWAVPAGGGGSGVIAQAASARYTTLASVAGTTFTASGFTVALAALASSSSKVRVTVSVPLSVTTTSTARVTLKRNGTTVADSTAYGLMAATLAAGYVGAISFTYMDSPGATTAPTYELWYCCDNGGSTTELNFAGATAIGVTTMIAEEFV